MNSDSSEVPHIRRKRYRGTHPRRYEEKYKELNPEQFSTDVERVLLRGQTPAGTHRPICVDEILSILQPKPGEVCLDATLGYGGHSRELIRRLLPGGRLFAIDVDPIELPKTEARLRSLGYDDKVLIVRKMNFAGIGQLVHETNGGFDCILADLGVSSMQLDNPDRGFSCKLDGPLDLRLNPLKGASASELLRSLDAKKLAGLLAANADEPYAEIIAKKICTLASPVLTTGELSDAVHAALNGKINGPGKETEIKKSQQRTFMALRIAVNDEFVVLDRFLELLPWCMKPCARVAILTFHSGEDRRVKKSFQKGLRSGIYSSVAPDPVRPSAAERRSNPRSSCAKLRWAVRSGKSVHETAAPL